METEKPHLVRIARCLDCPFMDIRTGTSECHGGGAVTALVERGLYKGPVPSFCPQRGITYMFPRAERS